VTVEMARLKVDLVRRGGHCVGMGEQKENLPIRCEQRHGVIHKILVVDSVWIPLEEMMFV